MEAIVTHFNRGDFSTLGDGKSVEYKNPYGNTLAYLDYNEDGTQAIATVFDPTNGHSREYGWRPVARAEAIVNRHLASQGYTK